MENDNPLGTRVLQIRKVNTPKNSDNPADYANVLVDDDYDGEWFNDLVPWMRIDLAGYVSIFNNHAKKLGLPAYLHHIVARPPKGKWVRFKNNNQLDCRTSNLEVMTPKEVISHRRPRGYHLSDKPLSYSKYKGVNGYGTKYKAVFRGEYVGIFDAELDAAKAYDKAAYAHHHIRQKLNFPDDYKDQVRPYKRVEQDIKADITTLEPPRRRTPSGKSLGFGRFR